MSNSTNSPHIALFPTSGMGHLTPFLRIAATLLSRGCTVTLITPIPTVSAAESSHISSFLSQNHPRLIHAELQTLPSSDGDAIADPFFLQWEATRRAVAVHLRPLIVSSKLPISALFADLVIMSVAAPITADLGLPCYTICTTSLRFLYVAACLPAGLGPDPILDIPGLGSVLASSLPPPFLDPSHNAFTKMIAESMETVLSGGSRGIIVNSFEWFEPGLFSKLNSLPKLIPIGPLAAMITQPSENNNKKYYVEWLDKQPKNSVVYVSFGSRTAMSRDHIRELSKGLERSGQKFLWVLKTAKVDKYDENDRDELRGLLVDSFLETTKERGLVLRTWAVQSEILGHGSVGLFLSHCGWNSVAEAAQIGVPILAWPLHGDQRLNAEVVERAGLGVWHEKWGIGDSLDGDEIGERIREAIKDENLRKSARKVGLEAEKAVARGGTSDKAIAEVLEDLRSSS